MSIVSKAGAVTFRWDTDPLRILIISGKKNPDHWIFPKGNINPSETKEEAAIRELREEAGVEGKLIKFAGTTKYNFGGEKISVAYYVIEFLEQVSTDEDRARIWCTIDESIKMLTYDDTKTLLKEYAWPIILQEFKR